MRAVHFLSNALGQIAEMVDYLQVIHSDVVNVSNLWRKAPVKSRFPSRCVTRTSHDESLPAPGPKPFVEPVPLPTFLPGRSSISASLTTWSNRASMPSMPVQPPSSIRTGSYFER